MSINWNVLADTPYGFSVPTYGNYGGPFFSDGQLLLSGETPTFLVPAEDPLDATFLLHDMAIQTAEQQADPSLERAMADERLIVNILDIPDYALTGEGHLYAAGAIFGMILEITERENHDELLTPSELALYTSRAISHLEQGSFNPDPSEVVGLVTWLDQTLAKIDQVAEFTSFGTYFSFAGYLSANPDVAAAGFNPLLHYHQVGWREGRDPSINFDTTLYLLHNPDVQAAGIDPLEHFLLHGINEGRSAYEAVGPFIVSGFDYEYYLLANPDVGAAGFDPLQHYLQFGWHEGRDPNAFFDTDGYLANNPDVAAAGFNPLLHYDQFGWREGRDPSVEFDTTSYLAAYADVAAAHINPLQHFLQFGIYEGRSAFEDGLWV